MSVHLFFFFGPAGGAKHEQAILLTDTLDQPARVISIEKELRKWELFSREY